MSPNSYISLKEFSCKLKQNKVKKFVHTCKFYVMNFPFYAGYILRKLKINVLRSMPKKHMCNPFSTTYILWGMDIAMKAYIDALTQVNKNE